MDRRMLWPFHGRGTAVLALLVAVLVAVTTGGVALAVAGGSGPADAAYGYVVRVNVAGDRGCSGVRLDDQLVATSKECFQVGATAPVTGPPLVAGTVTTRTDQGSAGGRTVAIDHLFVRDDRNLVLAHVATGLTGLRGAAPVSATAPAAGETLRVLGFGRTAGEWVPDLPHTGQLSVQDVSATEIGVLPAAGGAICKGDAGGPVIRENGDGTARLVAVVSSSWQGGCLGAAGTRRDATATRVDGLADWINQYRQTALTGVVRAGADGGCLVMQVGTDTYQLAGGDSAVVKAGETVHVTGYRAPVPADGCTQGIRFQVTAAYPVLTLAGTVTAGVENCLSLTSGGTTYGLSGGDRTVLKAGAKVTVTGYDGPPFYGVCPRARFVVLSAVPAQQISLRAHANGRYVTAENAGAAALIANRTAIGPWEVFDEFDLGNGHIALQARINGRYVAAENAGAGALIANRTEIGPWETFLRTQHADGSISLTAKVNGRYVTADNAGASPLIANRTAIGPWEKFDRLAG